MSADSAARCPCGAGQYQHCCGPYIEGRQVPPTAQQLMRSRYTAYTLGDDTYLRNTWSPATRPDAPQISEPGLNWLGLTVKRHVEDGDHAIVEFVARYKVAGRAYRLHEISNFVRTGGRWLYVSGVTPEKTSRPR